MFINILYFLCVFFTIFINACPFVTSAGSKVCFKHVSTSRNPPAENCSLCEQNTSLQYTGKWMKHLCGHDCNFWSSLKVREWSGAWFYWPVVHHGKSGHFWKSVRFTQEYWKMVCFSPYHKLTLGYQKSIQWNLDLTNDILQSSLLKCMEQNFDITKQFPKSLKWYIVKLRFHCIRILFLFNSFKLTKIKHF